MTEFSEHRFALAIGSLGVELTCPDANTHARLVTQYRDFLSKKTTDWQVKIFFSQDETDYPQGIKFMDQRLTVSEADGWGWLSPLEKKGELYLGLRASIGTVDYFLRAAFALMADEAGGFMLHAAGVVKDGRAHCCFGHSGSGKTTLARHSPPGSVMNDDLLLILPQDQEWIVHGTPFTNPTQVPPTNQSALLGGLYCLVQDQSVYLESMEYSQALAEIFSCLPVIPADTTRNTELLTRMQDVLAKYPVKSLHFMQNSSFWAILK